MHWAARHRNADFMRMALDHGGNPNLIAGRPSETPLFKTISAAGGGNRETMLMLLDAGADIDATMGDEVTAGLSMGGITPIMMAADILRFDTVHELLTLGADYRRKDDRGYDLAHRVARMQGRFLPGSREESQLQEVTVWLSERGVEIRVLETQQGKTRGGT